MLVFSKNRETSLCTLRTQQWCVYGRSCWFLQIFRSLSFDQDVGMELANVDFHDLRPDEQDALRSLILEGLLVRMSVVRAYRRTGLGRRLVAAVSLRHASSRATSAATHGSR
jgi:GNAT superfamily N-acetyltransferase